MASARAWPSLAAGCATTDSAAPPARLMNVFGAAAQEVHQDVLAERHSCREVSFALADLRHLFNEVNQVIIVRQHEGVDHDAAAAALRYFSESFLQNARVKPHRVFINA